MNFSVLPPEINSLRIFTGAGSAPMLEVAGAWDGLAAELASTASSFNSVTSGLAGASWQGAASQAMTAAAAPYVEWLSATTDQAEQAATQARTMASAFEAVRTTMVEPAIVAANRAGLLSLVQTNLFGFNGPAIAAAEAEYEEMWAADVAGMFGYYAEAAAAVSALTPFTQPLHDLPGLVAQLAGGGQAAAAALPAETVQTFDLLGGILDLEIGTSAIHATLGTPGITLPAVNVPPIHLPAFELPRITIPPIHVPAFTTPAHITVSGFDLPRLTIPSIYIPPGSTLAHITVGAFNLPQIATPAISVPPITLPQVTIPPFKTPLITVSAFSLPTITIPQINFPVVRFPDIYIPGGNQTILTIKGVLGALPDEVVGSNTNLVIALQTFDINAITLGARTQGFIGQIYIPPIRIGAFTLPILTISNPDGGAYVFPSVGLSGFTIPSIILPPIHVSGFTLPQISWPGFETAPLTIPPIRVGEFTLPQISEPGFTTPPLTIPPIGIGGFSTPDIHIPNIIIEPETIAQFQIPL
jgi:hypothetical protein